MLCFVSLRKGIIEREGREDASRELRPRRKAGVKDTPRVDHLPGQDEGMTSNSLPHEHCRGVLDAAILSTEENSCIPHYCEMQEELCHAEKPVKEKGYTRITLTCRQPLGNTFFLQYRIYADHGLHKYRCSRIGVITTLVDTANAAQYYLPPMRLWPWQTRTG